METSKKILAAGVVLMKEGKYLLVQERKPEVLGLWNWPAGRIEGGETTEEAAIREAKEETGFDVSLGSKIGEWVTSSRKGRKVLFHGEIIGGSLNIEEEEIMDARWFSREEIEGLSENLRSDWVMEALRIM